MKNKCIFKIIYHLYKKNKELEKLCTDRFNKIWDLNYYVECVKTNYEGARGAIEQILKIDTLEDAKYYAKLGLMYMDMRNDTIYKESEE